MIMKEIFEKYDEDEEVIFKGKTAQVGLSDKHPDDEFDEKELKMGIAVEFEHTKNRAIAKAIAKDHLRELPDYYTRLKKMEQE